MIDGLDFSRLKQEINLTQYAAYLGYEIDCKKSTRNSIAMRLDDADKVIISRRGGIWIYFSVYDDRDNGTIIDFAKNRSGKSIFQIGRELHQWLGSNIDLPEPKNYVRHVEEKKPDPERINRLFNYCSPATNHAYLESRGITEAVLRSPRFEGRIFQDRYGNAVFPHFKNRQVCGLELKGENAGLFVRGSEKTLWRSNISAKDNTLVIAEAAIDAISYHILFSLSRAFYVATSGEISAQQSNIIRRLITDLPRIKEVLIITDNNKGGNKLAWQLEAVMKAAGYTAMMKRHRPPQRGQDWNDVLKASLNL